MAPIDAAYTDPTAEEGYYLLFWNCSECGEEVIPAEATLSETGYYCPNCFTTHDNHRHDFGIESILDTRITDTRVLTLIEEGKITDQFKIIDPELIQKIENRDVDWKCRYCGTVHPDEGLSRELLYCNNCEQYQTTINDHSVPARSREGQRVAYLSGEAVDGDRFTGGTVIPESMIKAKAELNQDVSDYQRDASGVYRTTSRKARSAGSGFNIPWKLLGIGGLAFIAIILVFTGVRSFFRTEPVPATVTDLNWEITVDISELKTFEGAGWDEEAPAGANILTSKRTQRGTKEEKQGMKTIMVDGKILVEKAKRIKLDTQTCITANTGKGVGKRDCEDDYLNVPAKYKDGKVPKKVPNMVVVSNYDMYQTWTVDRWVNRQTLSTSGHDDEPRIAPSVNVRLLPYTAKASDPSVTCEVSALYEWKGEQRTTNRSLPCGKYDLLDVNDEVTLFVNRAGYVLRLLVE